jgi:hypothetical protein
MAPTSISPPSSVSFPSASSLPFPNSLRHNKSFVKLAHLLGLGSNGGSLPSQKGGLNGFRSDLEVDDNDIGQADVDGEDVEDDEGIDEDSLMWDAQVNFISIFIFRITVDGVPHSTNCGVFAWARHTEWGAYRVDRHSELRSCNRPR